ncbi:MAG: hypothetical protein A2987_06875 [Omnitrophica bacterium RIFCSPLOWO2_01_FULL_45_10]|nr:MAG: hypothetical protein A2987_06875 [Omnitrophica bacterium RIFCSPLOWO2_01_FULL_45_10]
MYLHFVLELLQLNRPKTLFVIYTLGLIFFVLNLLDFAGITKLFITNVTFVFNQFYVDRPPGPTYPFFVAFFFYLVGYAHWVAACEVKKAYGLKRVQINYFLWAMAPAFYGGGTAFIMVFGIDFYPFPHITVPFYPVVMTYAILRHGLMDIEVIIRKTLVFAGLVLMVMAIVGTVTSLTQSYLGEFLNISPTVSTILSVLIAILLYDPTRRLLVNLTDNYLFQKKFDYQKLLKDASEGISQIKSLHHLLSLVTHFITMRIRVKSAAVLIYDTKNHYYRLAYLRGYPTVGQRAEGEGQRDGKTLWLKEGHVFPARDPLIEYLQVKRQAIDLERIKNRTEQKSKQQDGDYDYQAIKQRMEEFHTHCAVPSFLSDRLLGILLLGEKKSGDIYTEEDLNVLYTIAQESAIAIENARLYDEAIDKARELEQINVELNNAQTRMMRALKEAELANEKLQITQASLIVAEKSATMVGMAKAIGHEVNNPLSIIIGRGEALHKYDVKKLRTILERDAKKLPPEDLDELAKIAAKLDDNLARMIRSGNRIDVAVKTLTNLLKDTKGEMHPLSLIVLCREAIEATRFSTYEENIRGCEIKESIASNIVIMGNLEQLIQVFVNLIKNAYEAMAGQKDRQIEIQGDVDPENPKMVQIDFMDNGRGIPPEILPKIWMQGFTTKARRDDSIGAAGQGQGLFVCKHMIESIHKGTITAESTVGKGTTFIIRLPIAEIKE